ncbi:hypothetical protein BH09MYX1_BH09MYX1_22140 [soil metagenome]
MKRVFVLNLDADQELEDPSARTPAAAMRARIASLHARLLPLVGDARILGEHESAVGEHGLAWCPTPSALDRLRGAGALVSETAAFEVLRRVNHRRFSFDLGATLPGERWVSSLADVRSAVGDGRRWLLKSGHGFAGRGQLRLCGALGDDEARVTRMLARGGAQLEPLVARTTDYALHGFISSRGALTRGRLTVQRCDERGAWLESLLAPNDDPFKVPFWDETARVSEALVRAGYFGPFGVDGFAWSANDGGTALRVRSEINARYSMGWAIGMGDLRPDLEL